MSSKVYIAVMGVTGSGKSTFIRTATGIDEIKVGNDLRSCTSQVLPYGFQLDGREVVLIDTPGFNDTLRSESEILKDIANWLAYTFSNPPAIRLSGIIYMQAITDRKIYGSTLRNLKMFRELCGENPLQNVVFTTSGWGTAKLTGDHAKAVANEKQLCEAPEFWEPLIRRKARVARFEDTPESALEIIGSLVGQSPVTLQIQKELVEERRDLIDTKAGTVVNEELKMLEERYKRELADIQREMNDAIEAKDVEIQESLELSRAEMLRLRDDARRAQDELRYQSRNDARATENLRNEFKSTVERMQAEQESMVLLAQAAQVEQQMQFAEIVSQLRANEKKVRDEERAVLEARIADLEGRKDQRGSGAELLVSLAGALGSVAMAALGFPIFGGVFGF